MDGKQTVWIIGSNSDIAKAFVEKYQSYFGTIVLASGNYRKVTEFRSSLKNDNILAFELDVSDSDSIDRFLKSAPAPEVVLLFAGHIRYAGEKEDTSAENIMQTYRTNAEGPSILIEKIYDSFLREGGGILVALSSCAGERGKASNRIYSASKAALSAYLEGFLQASGKDNVKTVLIKLGRADTKMLDNVSSKRQRLFSCSCGQAADFIFRCVKKNKSQICYYKRIWKLLTLLYRAIPLPLYNKSDF